MDNDTQQLMDGKWFIKGNGWNMVRKNVWKEHGSQKLMDKKLISKIS